MDQNLMATIGAIVGGTIPLGAVMFALIRWIDGRHRKDMALLRDEMKAGEGRLRAEMKAGEGRLEAAIGGLREEMRAADSRLESRIDGAISGFREDIAVLREDVKATEGRLQAEMQAAEGRLDARIDGLEGGVKETNEHLVNVGHRLSKVEGVIAGALMNAGVPDRMPVRDRRPARETRKGAA